MCNMSGWKEGNYAVVGNDLTRTYDNCGTDRRMENMKGKKWKIKNIHSDDKTVELYYEGFDYFYFSKCDLRLVDDDVKLVYPKPVKFDTANLDI